MSSHFFQNGLHGEDAHVDPLSVFEGLQWKMDGEKATSCPHSVWQILNHMFFWQDFILDYLKGSVPDSPEHAEDFWPGGIAPSNETEWSDTVFRFSEGLKKAENEAKKDLEVREFRNSEGTFGDFLALLLAHNSYHTGQVALIRRLMGEWLPLLVAIHGSLKVSLKASIMKQYERALSRNNVIHGPVCEMRFSNQKKG